MTAPPTPTAVDVKTFGAVGDGVTDDTAAFIRAANSMKNLVVSRPPAHYRLTGKVRLYASITGDGSVPEIRMYGADGQENHAIFEIRDYLGTCLVISGLHLNGQWDGVSTAGEWSHDIMIKGSKNVTVENNVLERPYGDCILVGGEGDPNPSENVVIRNNQMSGPRRCDVALISVRNLTIDGNVIRKSNGYVSAIDLEPNPNGLDADWGVTISNNQFDVLGTAVLLYHATTGIPAGGIGGNVTITGNTGSAGVFYSKTGAWTNVVLSNNTVN